MLHVYEFEVYEGDNGWLIVEPFDMLGSTQGVDFKEACEMAADWLQTEMEHRAMHDIEFPESTFGNAPRHGGKNIIVGVNADKNTVERMTQADAARVLGVTRGRVSQMVKSRALESFKDAGRIWVTKGSVEARLADKPKAGRPKKTCAS